MCYNWVCFANYSLSFQTANYWKCWHWACDPILLYAKCNIFQHHRSHMEGTLFFSLHFGLKFHVLEGPILHNTFPTLWIQRLRPRVTQVNTRPIFSWVTRVFSLLGQDSCVFQQPNINKQASHFTISQSIAWEMSFCKGSLPLSHVPILSYP